MIFKESLLLKGSLMSTDTDFGAVGLVQQDYLCHLAGC